MLEALDGELQGRLRIVKMNVDESQAVVGQLGIRSIATLVVFKGGEAVEAAVGALPRAKILELVTPHLATE